MFRTRRRPVVAGLTAAVLTGLWMTVTPAALAATGTANNTTNLSPNPVLASNLTGYGIQAGGTGLTRISVTDHVAASWAARVTENATVTRILEPRAAVTPGTTYTWASDVKAPSAASVQITVSWYNSSGGFLSYSEGGSATGFSQTSWHRASASLAAPAGAAVGETVVNVINGTKYATVSVTQHQVLPPNAPPANRAPAAAFTSSTSGLMASVNGTGSTDSDGTITGYSWNFGDGSAAGSGATASHTYATGGTYNVTLTVTDNAGATGTVSHAVTVTAPATITNLPSQPMGIVYADGGAPPASAYTHPGGLVIAGRVNYADQPFKDVSAAGGTELIYLDALINNPYGRYHDLLINASVCGAAVPLWPGVQQANSWGSLNDFRVGGVLQGKLHCVLETMVSENPQMGGFFADDLGSRSWYPGIDWSTFPDQQGWRNGAIALAQTFHNVAVEHGLMFVVNGTWGGGTLATDGGGYPNLATHGLSLADGGYIEDHPSSQLSYWTAYGTGQWGTASGDVSQGKPFMLVGAPDNATRDAYINAGVFAYVWTTNVLTPWGPFHPTGLPSKVAQ